MSSIPKKIEERFKDKLRIFQATVSAAKDRDANEADTVTIIKDIMSDIFGFNKYTEVSSEHQVRGTYCDLVAKIDDKPQFLVETKAVGTDLKDRHTKQAVDYAVHSEIDWVILTNGITWRVYKLLRAKAPVDQELVLELDFLAADLKNEEHASSLFRMTKEGWQKQAIMDYALERQALSKYLVAQIALSSSVVDSIRRELRKLCPDIKIRSEQVSDVLQKEVVKRELLDAENDKVDEARRRVRRIQERSQREKDPVEPPTASALPACLDVPISSSCPPPIPAIQPSPLPPTVP